MFESLVVEELFWGFGDRRVGGLPPDDGVEMFDEAAWESLLAGTPPVGVVVDESGPGFGDCAPSGWLAWDLDVGTAGPAVLSDVALIEAIVGFDRVSSSDLRLTCIGGLTLLIEFGGGGC